MNYEQLRRWLEKMIGPTAKDYTDEYVVMRTRNMMGFYGSSILKKWNFPVSAWHFECPCDAKIWGAV